MSPAKIIFCDEPLSVITEYTFDINGFLIQLIQSFTSLTKPIIYWYSMNNISAIAPLMDYGITPIAKYHFVPFIIVISEADVAFGSIVVIVIINPDTPVDLTIIINGTNFFLFFVAHLLLHIHIHRILRHRLSTSATLRLLLRLRHFIIECLARGDLPIPYTLSSRSLHR